MKLLFAVLYYHKNFWYKKLLWQNDEFASAKVQFLLIIQ